MNYQKLFSRFYSSGEQVNEGNGDIGEIVQKYGGNVPNFSGILSDEVASGDIIVESQADNAEFIDCLSRIDQEDDETLFVNQVSCDENSTGQTWEIPSQEDTMAIVEPLNPEEVRWFYKSKDDKAWTEFNGYDSLLIEEKYRTLPPMPNEEVQPVIPLEESTATPKPLSSDEEEHLKVIETGLKKEDHLVSPKKSGKTENKAESSHHTFSKRTMEFEIHSEDDHKIKSEDSSDDSVERDGSINAERIVVRGGLYEVDVAKMICESIYWPGEKYTITRGLYFYDCSWQPLERCHGEVLEVEHLRLFGQKACEAMEKSAAPPSTAVHSQHFRDFHVEWMSCREIYLYWGGAPRQLVRSVTQKLGFYQSTGYRLRRGYRTLASISERPPDITHVVFVIHGIGQKMDEGRIIRNTNTLRVIFEWLRVHHPCRGHGRAELFPARWRAGARGRAAGLLAAAAPPGAPALRRAINEAAMDVMYYTSPLYGRQVQDDLRIELNRLYTMFMARNPHFTGYFSAVAHSLGSVILYDIIIDYQLGCDHCSRTKNLPKQQRLQFQLQQLFCLGSPLSVFLAMRHPNPSLSAVLPKEFTPRLFNVFHQSDPVAYRLEPLVSRYHAEQPPVLILPYHATPTVGLSSPAKGPWKIWSYVKHPWQRPNDPEMLIEGSSKPKDPKSLEADHTSFPLLENEVIDAESATVICCANNSNPVKNKDSNVVRPRRKSTSSERTVQKDSKERSPKKKRTHRSKQSSTDKDDVLPYRLDYNVKDTGMANNYLSAITSHTSYWNNYDIAHFILCNLLPETGNEEET